MTGKSVLELKLSWKDVVNTNHGTLAPNRSAAEESAKSQGFQYFIRGHDVYDMKTLFSIGPKSHLRIHQSHVFHRQTQLQVYNGQEV